MFTALVMRHADSLEIATALRKSSPGVEIFFVVQTENSELAEIAKQHGNGTCLSRPITVETIQQATRFLQEPHPWEYENCEVVCGSGANIGLEVLLLPSRNRWIFTNSACVRAAN